MQRYGRMVIQTLPVVVEMVQAPAVGSESGTCTRPWVLVTEKFLADSREPSISPLVVDRVRLAASDRSRLISPDTVEISTAPAAVLRSRSTSPLVDSTLRLCT